MKEMLRHIVYVGILIVLVFFMGDQVTHAQQVARLTVSPVTFEFTVNPGQTLTNQIKVTNSSDTPLQLDVHVENISGTGEHGEVNLTDQPSQFELSSWIKTDVTQLALIPKESKIVTYTIQVPTNAEPGGHYGSILIGTTASDKLDATGAIVSQRIGSLVLVRVNGQATESATVNEFQPKTYVGSWDEIFGLDNKTKILSPKDEDTTKEKHSLYFPKGPIAFDILYQNTGNVHVKPIGYVDIYDIFGRKVAEQALDQRNVFPGGDRRITVIWPQEQLWGIHYRAQLSALYGSNNQILTASTTFWAFPPWAAGTIVGFLLFFLLARRRLLKMLRVLIKG